MANRLLLMVGLGALAVGAVVGYGAYWAQNKERAAQNRPGFLDGQGRSGEYGDGRMMEGGRYQGSDGRGRAGASAGSVGRNGQGAGMMGGSGGMGVGMGMGYGQGADSENCMGDGCLDVTGLEYPVGELDENAKEALSAALDDEYKAWTTYGAVMDKFGAARPFVMIRRAEEYHIAALEALFDKYGLDVPQNPYVGKIQAPDSMEASCQAGVDAEIANADLYQNTLLPKVSGHEDIEAVFTNLMNASRNRHLPAFEACN